MRERNTKLRHDLVADFNIDRGKRKSFTLCFRRQNALENMSLLVCIVLNHSSLFAYQSMT